METRCFFLSQKSKVLERNLFDFMVVFPRDIRSIQRYLNFKLVLFKQD